MDPWTTFFVVLIGFVAGVLGGLLGVGGSTVMIPGLTWALGYDQHLYQAAAMIANVAVCLPAAWRHQRSGAMTPATLRWMLPGALVFVLVGVWLSNQSIFQGDSGAQALGRVLAVFLMYVVLVNVRRLRRSSISPTAATLPCITPQRSGVVGATMGTIAGLLGIGGGAVAVPMQQMILRLPLRSCIANSSAIICISASVGAVYKNISLPMHGHHWHESVLLAGIVTPSCWLGGYWGAALTHRLSIRFVRMAFIALISAAAIKMAALPWGSLSHGYWTAK